MTRRRHERKSGGSGEFLLAVVHLVKTRWDEVEKFVAMEQIQMLLIDDVLVLLNQNQHVSYVRVVSVVVQRRP